MFKLLILSISLFWISTASAVDLSGITEADLNLFFNYLFLLPTTFFTWLVVPIATYYAAEFTVSIISQMFRSSGS